MSTGWSIGGLDLRRVGYNIRTNRGWDSFPGTKMPRYPHGFRHGDVLGPKGFYKPKTFQLALDIFPSNPDGTVTLNPEEHVQRNMDSLMGVLHAPDRYVTVQRTFGSPTVTREAQCAVLNAIQSGQAIGPISRSLVISLLMPYPMWHELPIGGLSGVTGAQVLTNNGNAPIGDAVLTCTSTGQITVDASGEWVSADTSIGNPVVIDTLTGIVTAGGSEDDRSFDLGQEWFPDFEPGANNLTITGTWDIDYYHTYF